MGEEVKKLPLRRLKLEVYTWCGCTKVAAQLAHFSEDGVGIGTSSRIAQHALVWVTSFLSWRAEKKNTSTALYSILQSAFE